MFYDQYLLNHITQSSEHQNNNIGLCGLLGKIVQGLYEANEQENEAVFEQNFEALTTLINEIYSGQYPLMMNATLDNGLAGLGLVLHSLMADGLIENSTEPLLVDIDAFVYAGAKKYFSKGNHAFETGGEGGLYYLTLRQDKNPSAKKYVSDLTKANFFSKLV